MEEGEQGEQADSSSDEDDEEDTYYAQLEESAPSAEDYSSQSDDDTEGNDSSSNIRYSILSTWVAVVHLCIQVTCNRICVSSYGGSIHLLLITAKLSPDFVEHLLFTL